MVNAYERINTKYSYYFNKKLYLIYYVVENEIFSLKYLFKMFIHKIFRPVKQCK